MVSRRPRICPIRLLGIVMCGGTVICKRHDDTRKYSVHTISGSILEHGVALDISISIEENVGDWVRHAHNLGS